jgi:Spy/CpxP family protein refolding chaperone
MLFSMKTRKLALIAILGIVGLASQVSALGYCYWDNWEVGVGDGWWNYNVPGQYSLSADQRAELNEIRAQTERNILPLQNQLSSLRIEIRDYAYRSDASVNRINEYRTQIRHLEDQFFDARLSTRNEINQLLTMEQRSYFDQGGYGWWDRDNIFWHMGAGMTSEYGYGMMINQRVDYCW